MLPNASPSTLEDYTITSGGVIAWKGEAFGCKNLGQAAKLIVRMLRPYTIVGLVGKG